MNANQVHELITASEVKCLHTSCALTLAVGSVVGLKDGENVGANVGTNVGVSVGCKGKYYSS